MAKAPEHPWDVTPKQAIALQRELSSNVKTSRRFRWNQIKTIAGADCAFDGNGRYGYAGVVVYSYPDLEEMSRVGRRTRVTFPYVPGLLSFREAPLLMAAFAKLKKLPDLILFDGQGMAHPRRFGIACHMGLLLDRPTIGCAKSRLIGEHRMPSQRPGSIAALLNEGQQIGNVLRTRRGVKPIFVSIGHLIDLESATKIVMHCVDRYRNPKPIRDADAYVAQLKRKMAT